MSLQYLNQLCFLHGLSDDFEQICRHFCGRGFLLQNSWRRGRRSFHLKRSSAVGLLIHLGAHRRQSRAPMSQFSSIPARCIASWLEFIAGSRPVAHLSSAYWPPIALKSACHSLPRESPWREDSSRGGRPAPPRPSLWSSRSFSGTLMPHFAWSGTSHRLLGSSRGSFCRRFSNFVWLYLPR